MRDIRKITRDAIEASLVQLGSGNHDDNLCVLRAFRHYYHASLEEEEFYALVFLVNDSVRRIVPPGADRRLRAVASRAIALDGIELGPNWDLADIRNRTAEFFETVGEPSPLLLRDVHDSETKHGGRWYLQDGSHRALGFAIALVEHKAEYFPWPAHLATNTEM